MVEEQRYATVQAKMKDQLLTFNEAMDYLRVGRSRIYKLMAGGQLTGYKVGCTWRFYREDLRKCVRRTVSVAQG